MRPIILTCLFLLIAGLITTGCAIEEAPSMPEISEEELSAAIDEMKTYEDVKDAQVGVERGIIFLALRVGENTSESHARELGQEFTQVVSSNVTIDEEFVGPEKDSVYDYYDLEIGVGTGEDEFIAEGSKKIDENTISW